MTESAPVMGAFLLKSCTFRFGGFVLFVLAIIHTKNVFVRPIR